MLNWLGDGVPLAVVTLAAALVFLMVSGWSDALLFLSTFIVRLADVGVKGLVAEPRPSPALVVVKVSTDSFSFPSGHVVGVSAVFGLLYVLAPHLLLPRLFQASIRVVAATLIATIGLARVWVGAHWPTDVLAGYLFVLLVFIPLLSWYGQERSAE
jgi:undecaprenyl-diphosphatase